MLPVSYVCVVVPAAVWCCVVDGVILATAQVTRERERENHRCALFLYPL